MRAPPAAELRLRLPGRELLGVFCGCLVWALVVRPGALSLPYFWDEADVYAPGAKWLADHDLNPTPGHFPDDWSRGHPPLLYVVASLAFRIFGPGPAVGHALIVPFTALALTATYALGAERGGRRVGIAALVLLGTSPLFLSMGAFLLPEMPLTALTVLALFLLSRNELGWAAVVGVLLVWIKETGVGPPIAIAAGVGLSAYLEARRAPRDGARAGLRHALRPVLLSSSPVLALAAFFVWQRLTAGYFVFPHHQNLLAARPFGLEDVLTVFPSIFLWHGRWVVSLAALGALVVLGIRRRWPTSLRPDATNLAIVFLFLGNAVFFAKMFWLERYALPVHPGLLVLMVLLLVEAGRALPERFASAAFAPVVVSGALGLASLSTPGEAEEHTFAFADIVESHRDAYARMDGRGDDPLIVTTWPLTTELREPWLGYVDAPMRSEHPDDLGAQIPDIVLVDPRSHRRDELRDLARVHGLSVLETVSHGSAPPLEIWSR
jgi:hypothetical protein